MMFIERLVSSLQGEPGAKRAMSKKDLMEREKERKKKKKARWMDKVKEIEESREKEKNKWQSFNHKAIVKSKKGDSELLLRPRSDFFANFFIIVT